MNQSDVSPEPKEGNAAINRIAGWAFGFLVIGFLVWFTCQKLSQLTAKAETPYTENTIHNLKSAISAYETEYRRFPVIDPDKSKDTFAHTDHALMDILLAADNQAVPGGSNPRRISFFAGHAPKAGKNGKYRKGVKLESGGTGELWDPFWNYYRVLMDTNSDNSINSPETPGALIESTIIVWSAGPDGDFDTWDDNIKTW